MKILESGIFVNKEACRVLGCLVENLGSGWRLEDEQGYLAHKKTPNPLGSPKEPRHRPMVGS